MGVTIKSKKHSFSLGFAGFSRFRAIVADLISQEVSNHHSLLRDPEVIFLTGEDRVKYFEKYDAKTLLLIESGKLSDEMADFLYEPDCDGEISRKQAKMIYELIKHCEDDTVFGYSGKDNPTRMSDLKKIFSDNTEVKWY